MSGKVRHDGKQQRNDFSYNSNQGGDFHRISTCGSDFFNFATLKSGPKNFFNPENDIGGL